MRQLKHDTERQALNQRRREVEQQYGPQRVHEQWEQQRQRKENRFAAEEHHQIPPFRPREPAPADLADGPVMEVVVELPLHRQKAIQYPQVILLEPVKCEPLLVRREPAEKAEVDVVVVAGNVGVAVMHRVVLPGPEVRTASQQIEGARHEAVDPRAVRVGLMSAIVLDIEPDRGHRQAQRNRQQQGQPPRSCK